MKRAHGRLTRALLGAALLWGSSVCLPAHAAPIELNVTGVVTSVSTQIASEFSLGQTMSAIFTYDSAAAPTPSLILTRLTYPSALTGGNFQIGSYLGTSAAGNIQIADDDPTLNDQIRWLNGGIMAASILTHDPFLFDITLADSTQVALSDKLLPLTLPDLSVFTERSWSLAFSPIALAGEQTAVGGRLLSATLTVLEVPEPSTLLLLIGAGWLAAALVRRRA